MGGGVSRQETETKKICPEDVCLDDFEKIKSIFKQLEKTRSQGYTNTIVYLELDPSYAVARDEYRGKTGDRTVGANVILSYPKKLATAFKVYKNDGKKANGVVDRVMHFKWNGEVDPRKGVWVKQSDNKYFLKRKLKKQKSKRK